ncbi:MAG TPA: adenine deaminase C-terminal domain-containing protein [bacterium]|nr:adenine deaminase C-terminal domain-containing protein [bacterium]
MLDDVEPGQDALRLSGGIVADVAAGALRRADVLIDGDRIVAVGEDLPAAEAITLDVRGRVIVPGYIEPHTHFSVVNPRVLAGALLRTGTTTAVVDALPLMALARRERLPALLEHLAALPLRIRHLIRLTPQAFSDEERFALEEVRRLWRLPSAAAVGEVTRWVDVLRGDPDLLAKIRAAREDGRRVEGHAPGASYERLAALAAAGVTSCHEAISAAEVEDRLRAGLVPMLRHSPIRPDLPQLLEAVRGRPEAMALAMFTVDGPTPLFVAQHGYLDHLMRIALRSGLPPMAVLRMATLNPARYFGFHDLGEIAPDRRADLNVLADLGEPTPLLTIARGRLVARDGALLERFDPLPLEDDLEPAAIPRLPAAVFARTPLPGAELRLVNDVITEAIPPAEGSQGGLLAALLDGRGRWITRARLHGFAEPLGGLATTYCSSFGDVLVLGDSAADMAAALNRLADDGGGVVVVEGGRELLRWPFEDRIYARMSWDQAVDAAHRFDSVVRSRGYRFRDPLFTLLFLSFDSLPWIRLTSRGVWDVRAQRALVPAEGV